MEKKQADITKLLEDVLTGVAAVQNGFDNYQNAYFVKRSPEFFCLELNGEAGELANIEKKQWKGRDIDHEKFSDEAADVLIALMNYSNARGVNLAEAVSNKLQRIESKRLKMAKEGMAY